MEEKLIKFMKENNFIHNRNSPEYNNVLEKEKKWQEIANKLKKDVKVVKKRWRTLRDTFNKEDQKIKITGYGMSKNRTWKYYDKMIFLRGSKKRADLPDKSVEEISEKIIAFMKENKSFRNINSIEYKDTKVRDDKFTDLAYSLGLTVNETKRRWNILKSEFYKEEQRLDKYDDNECAAVKYKYYEDLSFLQDSKKKYADNVNKYSSSLFEEIMVENDDDILDEGSRQNIFEESLNTGEHCNGSSHKINTLYREEHSTKRDYEEKMHFSEKNNILEKSALTSFFDSMALTVENANLPMPETLKLEMDILNVVTQHITAYICEKS